ncbi:hypothetical protein Pint_34958 [Pistacia integerrima]|uniref:Uncharacterized protein n=1 Tax=Pistacia integerrima TaxID=434235 RepID=A0ACC0Y3B1_9ROSI|nr:hypothetical protein Pint_34958 [Pistacia integerrima]
MQTSFPVSKIGVTAVKDYIFFHGDGHVTMKDEQLFPFGVIKETMPRLSLCVPELIIIIFKSEVNMDKSSPRGNEDWHWYMKSSELAGEGDLKVLPQGE